MSGRPISPMSLALAGKLVLSTLLLLPSPTEAQLAMFATGTDGATNWCDDSGTYCWERHRSFLAGLRIVGEPKFGAVFTGGRNRIESEGFGKLAVIGLETNLSGSLLGFQVSAITPGRTSLDERSPLRLEGRLRDENGDINVDGGFAIGLSLFDGILTFGYGKIWFDRRDIDRPTPRERRNEYGYLNVQAVSAVRTFIKQQK